MCCTLEFSVVMMACILVGLVIGVCATVAWLLIKKGPEYAIVASVEQSDDSELSSTLDLQEQGQIPNVVSDREVISIARTTNSVPGGDPWDVDSDDDRSTEVAAVLGKQDKAMEPEPEPEHDVDSV
jgi:hypothetical protein|eukprot:COSAG01_NODE_11403_length_1942_cov_14.735757_1_plen_126_part_00